MLSHIYKIISKKKINKIISKTRGRMYPYLLILKVSSYHLCPSTPPLHPPSRATTALLSP